MSVVAAFKIIIKVGRSYFGTNSKRLAENLVKNGGKRIPKNKLPKNAKITKAPDVQTKAPNVNLPLKKPNVDKSLPKNVQLRKDPPVAGSRTTTTKKTSQPKVPVKPKVSTKAPTKKTTRGFKPATTAKPKRTKPPLTRVPGRTNAPPRNLRSAPAATRLATIESGPEIDKSTVTPRNTPKTKTDRKFVPKTTPKTKKTGKPDRTAPPRTAPASGPATNESFGKAFKRNRKAGNATFMWRDKKYTTRFKEETIAQHKKKFGVEGKY